MSDSNRSLRSDVVVGVRVGRAELRDLIRRKDSRRERVALALLALLLAPLWLSALRVAYTTGIATRSGVSAPVVAVARNLVGPALLVTALFGGLGAAQSLSRDAVRPLLLTSVSTRALVLGKVLYLLGTWAPLLGLGLAPALCYAVGARAPLFGLVLIAGLLPLLVLAMLVGLSLAYLLWLGVLRLGLSERGRRLVTTGLSVAAFLGAFAAGMTAGRTTASPGEALPTGDPTTPIGWYADALFVGSPMAEPLGPATALAVGLVVGAVPLAFVLLVRLAPAFWYATPAGTDADPEERSEPVALPPASSTVGRTRRFLGRSRLLRVALGYARGVRRRPDEFVYLLYYLFPVAAVLVPVAMDARSLFPAALGLSLVALGVWFAGSVFCLNPLGSEGPMLPQIVLAPTSARTFVHARLLAGTILGWSLAGTGLLLLVVSGSTLTDWSPALRTVAVGTVGLAGTVVVSAAVALGVGSVLPKFETTEVFDSVEAVVPSVFAALVHGAVALAALGCATVLTIAVSPQSPITGLTRVGAIAVSVLVPVALADGSRRYAVARLRDHGRAVVSVDRPFSIYAMVGLAILSLALGQSAALAAFVFGVDLPIGLLLPILFVVEYLAAVVVALGFLYVTRRGLGYLDLSVPTLRDFAAIFGGLLCMLSLWAAASLVVAGLGLPAADHALFDAGEVEPTLLVTLLGLVLLVNGPVEELLYRNVIQKYLAERFATPVAISITSAIFALVHVPVYLTAGPRALAVMLCLLFVLSWFLGLLYARTRSLVVVAAVHGGYNAVLILALYATTV